MSRGYFGLQGKSFLFPDRILKDVIEDITIQNLQLPTNAAEINRITKNAYESKLRQLKEKRDVYGLSNYDYLILEKMSMTNGRKIEELKKIALSVRNLEANPALAQMSDFPTLHAKAKVLVQDELQNRVKDPKEQISYLVELTVNKFAIQLQKDYESARDSVGKVKAVSYASCLLELQLLQSETITNESLFKRSLLDSLSNGVPIDLLHIKSLRYTYPERGGLKIIPNTKEVESIGLGGERRRYPDEEVIFNRLRVIRNLLSFYGIRSRLTVLASDRDLEYLFPDNNSLIDMETKNQARRNAREYISCLNSRYKDIQMIDSLTGYLEKNHKKEEYEEICSTALREAKKGGGILVNDKILEMRVNHQYAHYVEMFGKSYTRELARHSASHQIANLLALSAVFDSYEKPPIVIIDGRGFETRLIGAYKPQSRSIFLTKLKDPVQVFK